MIASFITRPKDFFVDPIDVVEEPVLTVEDKERVLESWEQQCLQFYEGEINGQALNSDLSRRTFDELRKIQQAKRYLELLRVQSA